MNTLIVYYSLSGNAEYAAKRAAELLGADLLRLEPVKAYPDSGFKKFFWGGKSAVMAETPALRPYALNPGAYGRVLFAFPMWAGNVTPPVRTFVKENLAALQGKRVAAIACQSGSGADKAFARLRACLGVDLEARLVLIDPRDRPDAAKEDALRAFCRGLSA